ncbi:MAG: Omp28-related outer membrane protein [Bacteroidota bacterium]|nr:Omp28-related outer membrane protein [Bacteroidota bacterium]
MMMKKATLLKIKRTKTINPITLYIFLLVSILSSCKEEPPLVFFNLYSGSDSTYITNNVPAAQYRNSLLEDYTGVRCANCPDAHVAAVGLAASHNGRMNILSMHPLGNALTRPYNTIAGFQDFQLREAADLLSIFGTNKNLPSIGLDRVLNKTKNLLITNSVNDWSSTLDAQLINNQTSPLNIDIDNVLIANNDSLKLTCYITATQPLSDSVYLTLIILEDSIVNPQDNNGDIDTFYVHDNLARIFVTSQYGTYLKTNWISGRVYRKQIAVHLNKSWNINNCKVLAFVHRSVNTAGNSEIWHSQTKKIK